MKRGWVTDGRSSVAKPRFESAGRACRLSCLGDATGPIGDPHLDLQRVNFPYPQGRRFISPDAC